MKRVLVTGASGAIGQAISLELASMGFALVLQYRSKPEVVTELVSRVRAHGGTAHGVCFDVRDRDECRSVIEEDIATNGPLFGAVYNVGMNRDAPLVAVSGEDWDEVIGTNLGGLYNVIHPVLMPMVQAHQGGRIVTISSVSGLTGNRGQTSYSAAKAGIVAFTKSLALEMAKRDILVNCVAPGFIESEMISQIPHEEIQRMVPLRRAGTPEEVAGVVGFLFSDKASYLTGQVLSPNGGLI